MCKHVVKKLPFIRRYVPDRCKTWQMCATTILEKSGTLESVLDCSKNQQMCVTSVDNYPHALKFVHNCYTTDKPILSKRSFVPDCCRVQQMCDKALNRCCLYFFFLSI